MATMAATYAAQAHFDFGSGPRMPRIRALPVQRVAPPSSPPASDVSASPVNSPCRVASSEFPSPGTSWGNYAGLYEEASMPISSYFIADATCMPIPAPTTALGRHVGFASSPTHSVHLSEYSIQPYSEVYGRHPRCFNFDRDGGMVESHQLYTAAEDDDDGESDEEDVQEPSPWQDPVEARRSPSARVFTGHDFHEELRRLQEVRRGGCHRERVAL